MSQNIQVITESFLNVTVTSNLISFECDKRFAKDLTVATLKAKLELVTGCSAKTTKLTVYDKENKLVCALDNDDALLGSYPIDSGMRLHAEDSQKGVGEFEDVSRVEKFEISEEEYSKRSDTVRAFKEKNKLGRFNEEDQKKKDAERIQKEEEEKQKAATFTVGDRCEVRVPGQPGRRGVVKFVGETDFKPGVWVGIQYDEPHGKNDGSVGGKRYFECQQKYGGFVKPSTVEVGDFPEEDLGFDEDEM